MPAQQSLKIKYSNKRQNFIGGFIKNAKHFETSNIWLYCSTELSTQQMNRLRSRKKSEVKELLATSSNSLGIMGLNQNDRIEVLAVNDTNRLYIDDMVILYFTPSLENWTFKGFYRLPKSNDDIAWTETFTDASGAEIKVRYGILIQEAEGLKTKHIKYDREIWESTVSNYMSQVKIASEQELYHNVDAIVIDDDYVEPNYFALSNLGHFIENQLNVAVMA